MKDKQKSESETKFVNHHNTTQRRRRKIQIKNIIRKEKCHVVIIEKYWVLCAALFTFIALQADHVLT